MTYQLPAGIRPVGDSQAPKPQITRTGKDIYYTKAELGGNGIDKFWPQIKAGEMVLCDSVEERDRKIAEYNPAQGGALPEGIRML